MSDTTFTEAATPRSPPPVARGLINTLDPPRFAAACASLMQQAMDRFDPDVLVGVRTGGLVVAEAMADSVQNRVPVMPLTCRRASTSAKSRFGLLPAVLAVLPQAVVDGLRWLEHRLLSALRRRKSTPQEIDHAEAMAIGEYLTAHAAARRVLVVDDAVDSGVTLSTVLRLLREAAPGGTELRSAVVTVTLDQPLVEPDFALYRGVLCRFPWSFDAAG
ncbi:MAG TPA: phosphoribosyltransferase family protein [Acetobacteraceae bacterium]|nr:phosphoribosyltransferase family protein [Acetobacteraceae bacterium]